MFRTYGYDYRVRALTPLGEARLARKLLYRGSVDEERLESPVRWSPTEPLHETFEFFPNSEPGQLVRTDGGESLDSSWGRALVDD